MENKGTAKGALKLLHGCYGAAMRTHGSAANGGSTDYPVEIPFALSGNGLLSHGSTSAVLL